MKLYRTLVLSLLCVSIARGLPSLCEVTNFTFGVHDGEGSGQLLPQALGGCDAVTMASHDSGGMAGSFVSPRIPAPAKRRLNISFHVQSNGLAPTR